MYGVGRRKLIFVDMKHESIVVVYDSCQAIADEIADKLGAETVSVQSLNNRQVENCSNSMPAHQDGIPTTGFAVCHQTYNQLKPLLL